MTGLVDPLTTAATVAAIFDRLGIVYTIGGSITASFAGEPHASVDIDFAADIREENIGARQGFRARLLRRRDGSAKSCATEGRYEPD